MTEEAINKLRAIGVDRPDMDRVFIVRPVNRAGVRWEFKERAATITGATVGKVRLSETDAQKLWGELLSASVWFNTKSQEFDARIPGGGMIEKYIPDFLATVVKSIRRELNQVNNEGE